MLHGFRLAFRSLSRAPGFAVTALLTLALGIGANTVIFTLVNALLLRPLPFGEDTEKIVSLHSTHPTQFPQAWDDAEISFADLEDVRREVSGLEDVAGYFGRDFTLYQEDSVRVDGGSVTPNLFEILGVRPLLGRGFREGEGAPPGFESVVILGYGLWQSRFGEDPDIIGKSVLVNERELEVIGVMPPRFRFPERDDLWVPYHPGEPPPRDSRFLLAIGRMGDGTSIASLREEVSAAAERLARLYPETNRGFGIHVLPYRDLLVEPPMRLVAQSLLGAVGLVLLVACANLASLLLSRGIERQRELSVRAALGAGRRALVGQLLSESLLVGLAGGALGTLVALWGIDALVGSFPEELPFWLRLDLDFRVYAFVVALSLFASLAFGLLPAFRTTKFDLVAALGSGRDASSQRRHSKIQSFLVIGQIGASLALLVGAGLMFQSFLALATADAGFDDRKILSFRVYLSGDGYDPVPAKVGFFRDVLSRIEAVPGVRSASATLSIPADDGGSPARIVTRESPLPDGSEIGVYLIPVTPSFFTTIDLPLVEGRSFETRDLDEGAAPVAIVNRTLAERLWPRASAAGREIGLVSGAGVRWLRVEGVAPDVQYEEFGEETAQSRLTVYLPYSLLPSRSMAFLVAAEDDPDAVADSVREAVRSFAPGIPAYSFRTMEDVRYYTTWEQRFFSHSFAAFAVAALLLACLGTYGLVAYRTSRRGREIGVRLALGASERELLAMVLGEGAALAGLGLFLGLGLSFAVSRFIEGLLYNVPAVNPTLYGIVALFLATTVLAASYLPARRAARTEPTEALRQD